MSNPWEVAFGGDEEEQDIPAPITSPSEMDIALDAAKEPIELAQDELEKIKKAIELGLSFYPQEVIDAEQPQVADEDWGPGIPLLHFLAYMFWSMCWTMGKSKGWVNFMTKAAEHFNVAKDQLGILDGKEYEQGK